MEIKHSVTLGLIVQLIRVPPVNVSPLLIVSQIANIIVEADMFIHILCVMC